MGSQFPGQGLIAGEVKVEKKKKIQGTKKKSKFPKPIWFVWGRSMS